MVINKNRVLYPLRSNLGWFQTSNLERKLLNQIKQSILIYDEIYIERGTFIQSLMESQDGKVSLVLTCCYPFGVDKIPPEIFNDKHALEESGIKISISNISIGNNTPFVLKCNTLARFKIDYHDIFKNTELSDHEFIKFVEFNRDESATVNQEINEYISKDREIEDIFLRNNLGKAICPDLVMSTLNNMIIENLSYDLLYSINLDSILILDGEHRKFLDGSITQTERGKISGYETTAIQNILKIPLPDISKLSLEDALELRNDKGWTDLRCTVANIISSLKEDPTISENPKALESAIHYELEKALLDEFAKVYPTRSKLVIDLALGVLSLLPGIGVVPTLIDLGQSVKEYGDHKHSWVAFLMKIRHF